MSVYVDSSALLKRYVEEPESDDCDAILRGDPAVITAQHSYVEVQRTLARVIDGADLVAAQRVGGAALPFLTYDLRQAQAARSLGWTVLGA